MLSRLLLSLSLVPLSLVWSQAHAAQGTPDDGHDLAYSVGASLGERLRQDAPGLQLEALVKGLQQAYRQEPLALSDERMGQLLARYQAQADRLKPARARIRKRRRRPSVASWPASGPRLVCGRSRTGC